MLQPHLRRYDHLLRQRRFLIVPCLTALTPLIQFVSNRSYQIAGLTILHLGIALSIQHAVHVRYRVLNLGPVVWLGALSYSLYLWQQPFLNRGSTAWWTAFPLNLALALLCAAASHYLVERPFLALREQSRKEAKVVFPERVAMSGETLSEDLAACVGRPSSAA
jgi:peptidoglycan/LPS O-acetylase OafA/YrhL